MRILVCVKQICHIYGRSGSNAASSFLDDKDKIYRVNPYDESAMELALRIKDSFKETEVIMLTLGPIIAETELRRCFALGADDLYQIESEEIRDSWKKSNILAQAAKELKADLIFCGKESADQQNGQVGAFMAHHLRLPFVSAIMDISVPEDAGSATVQRSAGRGQLEIIESELPAVFSVALNLNSPRYPAYYEKRRVSSLSIRKLTVEENRVSQPILASRTYSPRPRPKMVAPPDSGLPAYHRVQQLLSGSRVEKKGEMVKGSPELQVEKIISFLKKNDLIKPGLLKNKPD